MRKINSIKTLICLMFIFAAGCVHKPDIEQGNIVTSTQISQLHKGMSEASARELLGDPVLDVPFNQNRLEYVYTTQKGGQTGHGKRLTLLFKNHKLVRIQHDPSFTFST